MHVRFHKFGRRPHVHVTYGLVLYLAVKSIRILGPGRVRVEGPSEEVADCPVDEGQAPWVGRESEAVWRRLIVVWNGDVLGETKIGRREVGEQRCHTCGISGRHMATAHALLAMARVALTLAAQVVEGEPRCARRDRVW